MRSVAEALELVVRHAGRQPVERVDLADSLGLVLAEPITSDIDSPPFSKSLMDGFAVTNADMSDGCAELRVLGEIPAGGAADQAVVRGSPTRS